jgi:hypothetical protein
VTPDCDYPTQADQDHGGGSNIRAISDKDTEIGNPRTGKPKPSQSQRERTAGRSDQGSNDEAHRQRLAFIRRSRDLGFSINDTRDLLGLARGHNLTCAEVKALTEQHVADIRAKIRDLRKLDRVLSQLAGKCKGSSVPDCPILDALAGNPTAPLPLKPAN